jgi:site-specific recombinase XerD
MWTKLQGLCVLLDLDLYDSGEVSQDELCSLGYAYAQRYGSTTLASFWSAVNKRQTIYFGLSALPRGALFKHCMAGVRELFPAPEAKQAPPILPEHLHALRASLPLSTFAGLRDWAMVLLAFHGMLRVSEYTTSGPRGAPLLRKHVCFDRRGVEVTLVRTKTSKSPVTIRIAALAGGGVMCPVTVLRAYLALEPRAPDSHLFVHGKVRRPCSDAFWRRQLKTRLRQARITGAAAFTGHSFRRDGATALAAAGVHIGVVCRMARWKSVDTARLYMDAALVWTGSTALGQLVQGYRPRPASSLNGLGF